jgi:aryl-alcohol dehydrogenase-like predicted oxidoreductase
VLDTTRELGIAFVAFSPVARGALAGSLTDPSALSEQDLRRRHPRFEPENWEKNRKLVQAFNALAKNANVSPAQLALAWVLSRGSHVHAIPGTRSIAHWQENHAALQADYSPDVFKQVDRLFEQQAVAGHRYPESIRHTIDTEDFEVAW